MRGPTVAALVLVRVICWPTIGARLLSKASTNCSTWRRVVSPPFGLNPVLNTVALWKRKSVSTLPSCRKPKPRTCGPWLPLLPALMALFRAGMPNIPIFWYAFLRCGTLKSWVSASKLEKLSVPKKPRLGVEAVAAVAGLDGVGGDVEVEVAPGLLIGGERVVQAAERV